jgi:hypothetical protein
VTFITHRCVTLVRHKSRYVTPSAECDTQVRINRQFYTQSKKIITNSPPPGLTQGKGSCLTSTPCGGTHPSKEMGDIYIIHRFCTSPQYPVEIKGEEMGKWKLEELCERGGA